MLGMRYALLSLSVYLSLCTFVCVCLRACTYAIVTLRLPYVPRPSLRVRTPLKCYPDDTDAVLMWPQDLAGEKLFRHSLFVLTSVQTVSDRGWAVCDAGTKAVSLDSGPPQFEGRTHLRYECAGDEHGKIVSDQELCLKRGDRCLFPLRALINNVSTGGAFRSISS